MTGRAALGVRFATRSAVTVRGSAAFTEHAFAVADALVVTLEAHRAVAGVTDFVALRAEAVAVVGVVTDLAELLHAALPSFGASLSSSSPQPGAKHRARPSNPSKQSFFMARASYSPPVSAAS